MSRRAHRSRRDPARAQSVWICGVVVASRSTSTAGLIRAGGPNPVLIERERTRPGTPPTAADHSDDDLGCERACSHPHPACWPQHRAPATGSRRWVAPLAGSRIEHQVEQPHPVTLDGFPDVDPRPERFCRCHPGIRSPRPPSRTPTSQRTSRNSPDLLQDATMEESRQPARSPPRRERGQRRETGRARPDHTMSRVVPKTRRPSMAACASAARSSGNVCPITGAMVPAAASTNAWSV